MVLNIFISWQVALNFVTKATFRQKHVFAFVYMRVRMALLGGTPTMRKLYQTNYISDQD